MEIEYKEKESKSKSVVFGQRTFEAFIATCDHKDDRLIFVKDGKMIAGINLKNNFVIQDHHDLYIYTDYKRISKLEVAVVLAEC